MFKRYIPFLIASIVLLCSSFTLHKFYLSVTEVYYSEEDKTLQMISRIFIDDLEQVLEDRYQRDFDLATDNEFADANAFIDRYLSSKMILKINGEIIPFKLLGKEYDNDVVKCYVETTTPIDYKTVKNIEIKNTLFFEAFEEQQNIIHFKLDKRKKSFILIRENDKGLLNF